MLAGSLGLSWAWLGGDCFLGLQHHQSAATASAWPAWQAAALFLVPIPHQIMHLPALLFAAPPQGLLEETADQPLAGNQLVAVLRQLQGMVKRCAPCLPAHLPACLVLVSPGSSATGGPCCCFWCAAAAVSWKLMCWLQNCAEVLQNCAEVLQIAG